MVVAVSQSPVRAGKGGRMLRGQLGKCSGLIVLINVLVLLHSSLASHSVSSLLMAFLKSRKTPSRMYPFLPSSQPLQNLDPSQTNSLRVVMKDRCVTTKLNKEFVE